MVRASLWLGAERMNESKASMNGAERGRREGRGRGEGGRYYAYATQQGEFFVVVVVIPSDSPSQSV